MNIHKYSFHIHEHTQKQVLFPQYGSEQWLPLIRGSHLSKPHSKTRGHQQYQCYIIIRYALRADHAYYRQNKEGTDEHNLDALNL